MQPSLHTTTPILQPLDRLQAPPSVGAETRAATPGLAATWPAAGQSSEAITRPKAPPLTVAGPVASPSIAPDTRAVTPGLTNGADSIPSSPSHSTSRSPSPEAVELISSLANYESLSDDALYDATLNAQQAMVRWQDEYMTLETEISRMRGSPYNRENPKANPRKLEDPKEYDRKHHESLRHLTPNLTQKPGNHPRNSAQPRATKPINMPASNGRRPRNELHIDMNEPMQPVEGKRIRKPRIMHDDDNATVTAPKNPHKRPREPDDNNDNGANAPATDPPPAKKQDRRTRSLSPPDWAPKKRGRPVKGVAKAVIKTEPKEETEGEDPVRAAAARATWARRRADGTNGRRGRAPKGRTVVKKEEERE